jgi:hypothetical protein
MVNELKIVLIIIAIYLVLGIQNFANTAVFLIPYELNPLVILSVSTIILLGQGKQNKNLSYKFIYFIGILFYSLLSSRTLSFLSNNYDNQVFRLVANNSFTSLIAILVFYSVILKLVIEIRTKSYYYYGLIGLCVLSFIGTLANLELLQVICFTGFVLACILYTKYDLDKERKHLFLPILYQLFLFILLENTYFILIKY